MTDIIQSLIFFVFECVLTIFSFILDPFFNAIFALFPSVSVYFTYIFDFLTIAVTNVNSILHLFLFTSDMFILLFDYFLIKYAIYLIVLSIRFIVNVYSKLKG